MYESIKGVFLIIAGIWLYFAESPLKEGSDETGVKNKKFEYWKRGVAVITGLLGIAFLLGW